MSEQLPALRDDPALPAAARAAAERVRTLSTLRKVVALLVAALSDAVSVFTEFAPPVQLFVDGATALVLFAVLGFRWPLLPVLVVEAVPGLALFPTWLLAVGVIAGTTPSK